MIKSQSKNPLSVFNFLCGALVVVLIALWCMPYWQVDSSSVSMFSYIAMPEDHKALSEYIAYQIGENYNITSIVGPILLQLIFGVVAMFLCFFKSEAIGGTVVSLISGCCGVWGLMTKKAFKLGSLWGAFSAASVLLVIVASLGIMIYFINKRK